ncbi:MAG: hypothetical protein JWO37_1269 [Acidimicrobiales bacterium]|jgi:uncharacterized protein (DUF427 family)|nr:hypothetical protein [Acidimicrobiales bacterium]
MQTRTPKVPGQDHPITIEPASQRIVVHVGDTVVADTTAALTLREAGYRPVHYIPISDVDQTMLRSSQTSTYCPYKGDASYYSIAGPDGLIEDAIWTYEHPYAAVETIAGHLAFYADRVQITETGEGPDADRQTVHS